MRRLSNASEKIHENIQHDTEQYSNITNDLNWYNLGKSEHPSLHEKNQVANSGVST